jgi:ribosome-binding protein aMBF1 (putative translation factor)
MATRWSNYYRRQLEDPEMRELVEKELASLSVGIQIARLREQRGLSQTQLAARAGMSAPKISVLECSPKDAKLSTLIRIARALGLGLKVEFVPEKSGKSRHAHVSP